MLCLGITLDLFPALLACFLNGENADLPCTDAAEGKEKTVSIETEAILSGNYWLLTKKHMFVLV